MTFSIVGRDPANGDLGVAVASKFLAVGAAVPSAALDVGAVATQAMCNTLWKAQGLDALRTVGSKGSAQQVLADLVAADDGRDHRQAGIVDPQGGSATYTGSECMDWAGGVSEAGVAIQGNILAGPEVVQEMLRTWHSAAQQPLQRRLYAALVAGDAAGGDRRGRQSAALRVVSAEGGYTPGDDLAYDLRVDDHPDPVTELGRLLDLHDLLFARPAEHDLLPLDGDLADEVRGRLRSQGFDDLEKWAGVENLELRLRPGKIDKTVLEHLRSQTPG